MCQSTAKNIYAKLFQFKAFHYGIHEENIFYKLQLDKTVFILLGTFLHLGHILSS